LSLLMDNALPVTKISQNKHLLQTTRTAAIYFKNEFILERQPLCKYFKLLKHFIQTHYPSSCFMKFVSAQHENLALDSTKRWNLITDFNNLLDLLNKKATALIPLDMRPTLTKCNNFHCFKRMACCQELHRDFQFPVFSMVSFCLWDHLEPNYIV